MYCRSTNGNGNGIAQAKLWQSVPQNVNAMHFTDTDTDYRYRYKYGCTLSQLID